MRERFKVEVVGGERFLYKEYVDEKRGGVSAGVCRRVERSW